MTRYPHCPWLCLVLALGLTPICIASVQAEQRDPHAVFVVGTPHYNPFATMPPLAEQLERFGFRTTVVLPSYDPEKEERGLPGLDALQDADVAILFVRFLTLPDDQLQVLRRYLQSGKPVVGIRTSTHAFAYPNSSPRARWNDGFGRRALGSKYFIHLAGSTEVSLAPGAADHPILTGVDLSQPRTAAGTLYLAAPPDDAEILLHGTGKSNRIGTVTNGFGTHELKEVMTDDVAWTWTNDWGGRVFTTTLGHPGSFADPNWVRLFINAIHWAADQPVPAVSSQVHPIRVDQKHARLEHNDE